MIRLPERLRAFFSNRWLVFVAAMWIQSCAGVGYLFGSISPVIKSSLNYNQRQVARLGVAKDLGDSIGFWIGSLCEIAPLWVVLLIGALQNLIGYGWVWLIITHQVPTLPLWAVSIEYQTPFPFLSHLSISLDSSSKVAFFVCFFFSLLLLVWCLFLSLGWIGFFWCHKPSSSDRINWRTCFFPFFLNGFLEHSWIPFFVWSSSD